tara:strand:- start:624 stop:860 length:237 start_codon:yes stop_codon:yes gene_type:complete
MIYFTIIIGQNLLGSESYFVPLDLNLEWIKTQLSVIWKPLLAGSLACGIVTGVIGFIGVRTYYRIRIFVYKRRKKAVP